MKKAKLTHGTDNDPNDSDFGQDGIKSDISGSESASNPGDGSVGNDKVRIFAMLMPGLIS